MILIPSNKQLFLFLIKLLCITISSSSTLKSHQTKNESYSSKQSMHDDGYSIIPREFYKSTDYYSMLSYIFAAVKFENTVCEYTFQNCLLNMNNQENVRGFDVLSRECFPLQKSRFCLQEVNFKNSDCVYKKAEAKIINYFTHLTNNLETCISKYPNSRTSELNASNKASNNSYTKAFFLIIFFIIFKLFF